MPKSCLALALTCLLVLISCSDDDGDPSIDEALGANDWVQDLVSSARFQSLTYFEPYIMTALETFQKVSENSEPAEVDCARSDMLGHTYVFEGGQYVANSSPTPAESARFLIYALDSSGHPRLNQVIGNLTVDCGDDSTIYSNIRVAFNDVPFIDMQIHRELYGLTFSFARLGDYTMTSSGEFELDPPYVNLTISSARGSIFYEEFGGDTGTAAFSCSSSEAMITMRYFADPVLVYHRIYLDSLVSEARLVMACVGGSDLENPILVAPGDHCILYSDDNVTGTVYSSDSQREELKQKYLSSRHMALSLAEVARIGALTRGI